MSTGHVEHDKLAYRLTQILVKLNDGESLDPLALAEQFGVHTRTIQRDLNTRFASLALKRVNGCYRLDPLHLGKLNFSDIERFANLAGVRGLFPKLTSDFTRELVDRNAQSVLLVKGYHYEDMRGKEGLFSLLEQAISKHQRIKFDYIKLEGLKSFSPIEPYKLINHSGIWYLAGKESEQLKSWTFTKIENLQTLDIFTPDPNVHDTLKKEDGIWLNAKKIEVVLKVSPTAAIYFQRRSLIAHQVIEKELEDGGLIVSRARWHTKTRYCPLCATGCPMCASLTPNATRPHLRPN